MIAVDTDVLVIARVFKDDPRYTTTADFLARHALAGYGVPIFSLLELCGVMATAKQSPVALQLLEEYLTSPTVQILYPPIVVESVTTFWANQNAELVTRIKRGMRRFCGRLNQPAVKHWSLEHQTLSAKDGACGADS